MEGLVNKKYEADLKNAVDSTKKHLWEAAITNGQVVISFNVSAKTVNSALSKSSKYIKDQNYKEYKLLGIRSFAVIDY